MSLVHLQLKKTFESEGLVSYDVFSPDFGDDMSMQNIGLLRISKSKKNYTFLPAGLAVAKKMFSPELYGLAESLRKEKLANEYVGYAWGAWSMTLHHWAHGFIENNEYPKIY